MVVDARDEAFHGGDDPYWRESAWYHFSVPERKLIGFVYFFYDLRTGLPGGGPAVWDPSGEEIYDCRFYDWRWHQPAVKELDPRDFTLPNGLRQQVVEPMQRYRLSYDSQGFALDLTWTAIMEPHEIRYDPKSIAIGARHFDQPGRATGSMVLDGERIEIDCVSLRDRTWGPHRPGATRSGDYFWAIASPDSHWHAITGTDEDGVERVLNGYLFRDGRCGDLVSGSDVSWSARETRQRGSDSMPSTSMDESSTPRARSRRRCAGPAGQVASPTGR